MQVDSSIYMQQQAPDILGNIQRGLATRQAMDDQAAKKQEVERMNAKRMAFSEGMTQNPDGTVSFDANKTMSALAKGGFGEDAYGLQQKMTEQQRQQEEQDFKKIQREIDLTGRLLSNVKDQPSYENALRQAKDWGLDVDDLPRAYDQNLVNNMYSRTMSVAERLQAEKNQKDAAFKERELGLKQQELGQKKQEKLLDAKKQDVKTVRDQKTFAKRYSNITDNITALKEMINKKGTYEAFGPHNRNMQQLIDSVAIDSAKMFDPESVARESEVAAFKQMLIEGGELGIRNSTAIQVLDNYEKMLKKRAQNEVNLEGNDDFSQMVSGGEFAQGGGQGPMRLKTNEIEWAD